MTRHSGIAIVGFIAVLLNHCPAAAADDDSRLLQGKWKVLTAKNNGGDIFEAQRDKLFVIIENGELRVVVEGTKSEQAATFTLDPKQNPKHIEFTNETRDAEWEGFDGKVVLPYKLFQSWKLDEELGAVAATDKVLGIYELKDDTLKICWRTTRGNNAGGGEPTIRPDKFESDVYYHEILFELRRVATLSFASQKASAEDRAPLENCYAWKWQCRTVERQQLLLLSYCHYTRDASGKLQQKKLLSSSDYSGNMKVVDVLVLLSIDKSNVHFSNTFSRPNAGTVGGSGEFQIPSKGFRLVGTGDGGSPTRIGEHLVLLAKTRDGQEPKLLDDLTEFISVEVTVAE